MVKIKYLEFSLLLTDLRSNFIKQTLYNCVLAYTCGNGNIFYNNSRKRWIRTKFY
jgi:hypothetical protein